MADYTKMAFSGIRSYLWTELQSQNILNPNDYWVDKMSTKLNPIIPSQQIPEFQNLLPNMPYIVYDIETLDYGSDFWVTEEVATLTVVGSAYSQIYSIVELTKDLFRRYDISASEINKSLTDDSFRFLKTYISGILSPNIGSESNNQTATIEITYCYTRNLKGLRYL
jgi:hypothetical protein